MNLKKIFLFIFASIFCSVIFANADPAPLAMIKNISQSMFSDMDKNLKRLKIDDKYVYDLVDKILLPHFELQTMAKTVVGRPYWQDADKTTQDEFIKEFTRYVTKTYANAIQSYDGEKLRFYPVRDANKDRVQIDSSLITKSGPPIELQYRLLKQGNNWLIYDFSVDGISIVQNYNSQFAGTLRQGGLTKLVNKLKVHNEN